MRKAKLCVLIGAPLILSFGSASAQQRSRPAHDAITVTAGTESISQWSHRVGRELDENIVYPRPMGTADYAQGIARVTFHCTDTGVPADVTLARSSGSYVIDRAALHAVARLKTLHPLPQGVNAGQRVEAWIVLALDERSRDRMVASLHHDAQLANAAVSNQIAAQRSAAADTIVVASR